MDACPVEGSLSNADHLFLGKKGERVSSVRFSVYPRSVAALSPAAGGLVQLKTENQEERQTMILQATFSVRQALHSVKQLRTIASEIS